MEETNAKTAGMSAYYQKAESTKLLPKKVFFTSGSGSHEDKLVSFELALRDAGIERFNLVPVSSIYPPGCEIVDKCEGLKSLFPGQIVFCVMAKKSSNEAGKEVFATIGAAIPSDNSLHGYLTEYQGYTSEISNPDRYSEEMAAYMLKTAFGIEPSKTINVTSKAKVEEGKYTTVVAAAVFVI